MAKLDENGLLYFWQRIKSVFATKSELKEVTDSMGELGYGDMMKANYDTDNNGKVDNADNADKLGGQSPSYYAKAADIPKDYAQSDHDHTTADITDFAAEMNKKANATHTHQQSEVVGLEDAIGAMAEIAQGKCKSYTFDTVAELEAWLENAENTADLNTGDVFLIRAVDVPDYWWDGETNTKQILETTKVDLSVITNAEIDAILAT